jgi:hypothetical protein
VSCLGGVDVVLNSLTSPGMVGGSLAVLKQGGRFVEIGKRDIWTPAAVAAERADVSFSLLAVDFLPGCVVQSALQRVAAGVAAGRLAPLPVAVHNLSAATAALRQLSQVSMLLILLVVCEDNHEHILAKATATLKRTCHAGGSMTASRACDPLSGRDCFRSDILPVLTPPLFLVLCTSCAGVCRRQGCSVSSSASLARPQSRSLHCWMWRYCPYHRRHRCSRPPGSILASESAGRR